MKESKESERKPCPRPHPPAPQGKGGSGWPGDGDLLTWQFCPVSRLCLWLLEQGSLQLEVYSALCQARVKLGHLGGSCRSSVWGRRGPQTTFLCQDEGALRGRSGLWVTHSPLCLLAGCVSPSREAGSRH